MSYSEMAQLELMNAAAAHKVSRSQGVRHLVTEVSKVYLWWAWLIPAAGCVAFIWDGIFIGLTATRGMLVSSFVSALVFFCVYGLTVGVVGNHGLWLAMVVYLVMRGVLQTIWYRLRIFNGI